MSQDETSQDDMSQDETSQDEMSIRKFCLLNMIKHSNLFYYMACLWNL